LPVTGGIVKRSPLMNTHKQEIPVAA
jgi:hypothetical protein